MNETTTRKYYGIASMVLATAALFIFTPALSLAAITIGIVGIVTGHKEGDRKLRGESIFGTALGAFMFLAVIIGVTT